MRILKHTIMVCMLIIGIIASFFTSNAAMADTGSTTSMNEFMNKMINETHPAFSKQIAEVKKLDREGNPNISVYVNPAVTHENAIYTQAQNWTQDIQTKMNTTQIQILSYNDTFKTISGDIQNQIKNKNKEQVLQLLEKLKDHIATQQQQVLGTLATIRNFREEVTTHVQQLNTLAPQVGDATNNALSAALATQQSLTGLQNTAEYKKSISDEVERLMSKHMALKTLGLAIGLISDTSTLWASGNGELGKWLSGLETIDTDWTKLAAKLQNLIKNINEASNIDWNFVADDVKVVNTTWDNIQKLTTSMLASVLINGGTFDIPPYTQLTIEYYDKISGKIKEIVSYTNGLQTSRHTLQPYKSAQNQEIELKISAHSQT